MLRSTAPGRFLFLCLTCLLVIATYRQAFSQEYAALHYTTNDGLPSNTIYSLYRDSKGFIWIATDKGVARYNGSKFEIFTTFDGLPDNEVYFFEEDPLQRLWIGCNNGSLCYFQNDTFFTAANKPFLSLPSNLSLTQHISVEYDSSITVSYSVGTKFINICKEHLQFFDIQQLGIPSDYQCIMPQKLAPNKYKLIYRHRSLIIDTNIKVLEQMANIFTLDRFTSCQKQTYLFGQGKYSTVDFKQIRPLPEKVTTNNYPIEIYADGASTFFATASGLILNDSVRLYEGRKISGIVKDNYGNYWVSSLTNGLYCLSNKDLDLKSYKSAYGGKVVYTHSDGKRVFFATDQNEFFVVAGNEVRNLVSKKQIEHYGAPGLFQSAFYMDSNYHYYNLYDSVAIEIDDVRAATVRLSVRRTRHLGVGFKLMFSTDNKLYVKKYNVVVVFDKKTLTEISRIHNNGDYKLLGMAQEPNGAIWYSTITSIFRIEGDKGLLQQQLKDHSIKSFEFVAGYMIAITHENRLLVINNANTQPAIDTVDVQRQCIWESVHKIDANHVIIGTNNSYILISLEPAPGKPKYEAHILENSFIPLQAESIASCGKIIHFFSNGEITTVDINKLRSKPQPPTLFFTSIQTSKRAYPIDKMVTIPFGESNTLRISFSRLSFGKIRSFLQYAVSKNGQYSWTDFNAEELNLAHPGYGDYVVMIRARTFTSAYSAPITFTLRILRPFWAQWWFIGLLCIIGVVLLVSLVLLTKKNALRTTQRKNLQMELELKAIYAQINPHFIFNSLNAALLLVRKQRFEDAYTHISQFSRLLRSYIKSARNKLITIADETGNLTDYLELQKTRFVNRFEFTIFVDQTIDPYGVKIPSLLLQPFVENALNHGLLPSQYPGNLKIEFVPGPGSGEIICKIDDNGIGRSAAKAAGPGSAEKGDSYGDLLIRDLVNIFNKYEQMNIEISYIDKQEPATGTTVQISIRRPIYE